jgi:arylsulfatase A-like enzyme
MEYSVSVWEIMHGYRLDRYMAGGNDSGVVVSDRFASSSFIEKPNLFDDILPNLTFPENLAFTLADQRINYTHIGYAELSSYLRMSESECQKILATPFTIHNRIHHLRLILARTETYAHVLLDCLKNHPSDLTLTYFDGTDSVAHLFMQERPPRQPAVAEADFILFSNAVDAMYERMDRLVKDVLDRLDERDTLIVISDHGFRSGEERLKRSSLTTVGPAVSWHREEGTIIAYGPTIQSGEIHNASVFDIAPTLLAMQGIMPSPQMPGTILPELAGGKPASGIVGSSDRLGHRLSSPCSACCERFGCRIRQRTIASARLCGRRRKTK